VTKLPVKLSDMPPPETIESLVALAVALGAEDAGGFSEPEAALASASELMHSPADVRHVRSLIRAGLDPLGDAYCAIRTPEDRRYLGQTYTPAAIIKAMVGWASDQGDPQRIVDPGAGSGRYLLAAARRFPRAELHGADIDPLATIMLRANIAASGLGDRATVHLGDYRALTLEKINAQTLFIGNPPYVRHHLIDPEWKQWLLATAARRGLDASGLAGLHVHFFLATAEHGQPGDYGAFITSSEWLDVNYGKLVRQLLLDGLGGESLHVLAPTAEPFADATTTGAITCFKMGQPTEKMKVRRVETVADLGRLAKGRAISRERLAETNRWSVLTRVTPKLPEGYIELGELCRVHRGAVTGANDVWVQRGPTPSLPDSVLFPTVTKARELFGAGSRLDTVESLRKVVDLPVDLDAFDALERRAIERFLRAAKAKRVHEGYVASARKAWWSVGLREAAPILATYMARRPPAFVRNDAQARHINIAHGLYPRESMTAALLDKLAAHLRSSVSLTQGRTYAGGLVKFEPKEMERIPVPSLAMLAEGALV
jgi:adenine-specific DNA-methyltransferase